MKYYDLGLHLQDIIPIWWNRVCEMHLCHLSLTVTSHNPKIMLIEDNIQLEYRELSNQKPTHSEQSLRSLFSPLLYASASQRWRKYFIFIKLGRRKTFELSGASSTHRTYRFRRAWDRLCFFLLKMSTLCVVQQSILYSQMNLPDRIDTASFLFTYRFTFILPNRIINLINPQMYFKHEMHLSHARFSLLNLNSKESKEHSFPNTSLTGTFRLPLRCLWCGNPHTRGQCWDVGLLLWDRVMQALQLHSKTMLGVAKINK